VPFGLLVSLEPALPDPVSDEPPDPALPELPELVSLGLP
jgi:hypothetical protein